MERPEAARRVAPDSRFEAHFRGWSVFPTRRGSFTRFDYFERDRCDCSAPRQEIFALWRFRRSITQLQNERTCPSRLRPKHASARRLRLIGPWLCTRAHGHRVSLLRAQATARAITIPGGPRDLRRCASDFGGPQCGERRKGENTAPVGSWTTENRPTWGMSMDGTSTLPPSGATCFVTASTSATAMYASQ